MSTTLTYSGNRVSETFAATSCQPEPRSDEGPSYDLIEFFFAYRDFIGDPDRILCELGLGRAHHRVVHFVSRRPGLPVAELLETLKITKQSLNRVLKELVDRGYVESRAGTLDRRQRLLYPTERARELGLRLARLQTRRILKALGTDRDADGEEAIRRFLFGMIDAADRAKVRDLIGSDNLAG